MNPQRANLVLVFVISLLVVGPCLTGIRRVRAAQEREETKNNHKAVALALQAYNDEYRSLPAAFDRRPREDPTAHPVSLHVRLLPYLSQKMVFDTFLRTGSGNGKAVIPEYLAADDGTRADSGGVQNFAANLRVFSLKGNETANGADMPPLAAIERGGLFNLGNIPDGVSNTIGLATKLAECGQGGSRYAADPTSPFAAFFGQNGASRIAHYSSSFAIYQWAPRGNECLICPLMAQTYHPRPLIVALLDGSIREVDGGIEPEVWNRALKPNDY